MKARYVVDQRYEDVEQAIAEFDAAYQSVRWFELELEQRRRLWSDVADPRLIEARLATSFPEEAALRIANTEYGADEWQGDEIMQLMPRRSDSGWNR